MRTDDGLGVGMDAAITLLVFFGIGFALDRWWGTAPLMMISLALVASVGLFLSWKGRYTAQMERLEARHRGDVTGNRHGSQSTGSSEA